MEEVWEEEAMKSLNRDPRLSSKGKECSLNGRFLV